MSTLGAAAAAAGAPDDDDDDEDESISNAQVHALQKLDAEQKATILKLAEELKKLKHAYEQEIHLLKDRIDELESKLANAEVGDLGEFFVLILIRMPLARNSSRSV